jgi:hypothetical protein
MWILKRQGKSHSEIAQELGVGYRNVAWVMRGRSWKYLIPDWARPLMCKE